ncbi:MAG: hypothetical protein V4618_17705 [Pseudomonadota bacterium]
MDDAPAHPCEARRPSPARRLAPSEDRRDRRFLRLLRRHRHDRRPLGHARARRRQSRPRAAQRHPGRSVARCHDRAAGPRRRRAGAACARPLEAGDRRDDPGDSRQA